MKCIDKKLEMPDRRRDPGYKNISGYVTLDVFNRVKQKALEHGLKTSEALEEALLVWLGDIQPSQPKAKDVYDLVAQNLEVLKSDFDEEKLNQIIQKEFLPTPADFSRITEILGLDEVEARRIWNATYTMNKNYESINTSK